MSLEGLDVVFHVTNIKQFDEMVTRGGQKPVAILIPLDFHHSVLMGVTETERAVCLWA